MQVKQRRCYNRAICLEELIMKVICKCIVCQSTKSRQLYTSPDRMFDIPGNFVYMRCISCGLVFLHPQPDDKTLRKHYPSEHYFAYNKGEKGGIFGSVREYVVKHAYKPTLLSRVLTSFLNTSFAIPVYRKGGKILDVGCGTGDILVLLKDLGWDTYGIDIDKKGMRIAKERGLTHMRVGTYKDVDKYQDNYFDCIRLYHVIEHINDPSLCLKILYKKLKPQGELFLCTPNFNTPIQKIFGSYWSALDAPRHLYLFTPQTLARIAKKYNFAVVSVTYDSALALSGSLQYLVNDILKRRGKLFVNFPVALAFYPIEWLLDKMNLGYTFTMQLTKK